MANAGDPIEAELDRLDAEESGHAPRSALRRFLPATLAVVTIAAFGGVVWYAYSTGVREGSEFAAPLLEPAGPSKVAPQDPGGREILDQDKLVYGTIDRSANGGGKVERLLPPPENPLPLPVQEKPAEPPPVASPQLDVPKEPPTMQPPPPSITGPMEPPERGPVPPPPEPRTVEAAPPAVPPAPAEPKPAVPAAPAVPAPVATPEPAAPPKVPAPVAEPKAPEPPKPEPVQTAKAVPGADNYRVQIASLRTEEDARTAWERRVKEAGPILGDLKLSVVKIDIKDKGTFFRAQGGPFADKEAAQGVCEALKLKKIGCFVVKP